jgi:hypothetical protein
LAVQLQFDLRIEAWVEWAAWSAQELDRAAGLGAEGFQSLVEDAVFCLVEIHGLPLFSLAKPFTLRERTVIMNKDDTKQGLGSTVHGISVQLFTDRPMEIPKVETDSRCAPGKLSDAYFSVLLSRH